MKMNKSSGLQITIGKNKNGKTYSRIKELKVGKIQDKTKFPMLDKMPNYNHSKTWKTKMAIYVECCDRKIKPKIEINIDGTKYIYHCNSCGNYGIYEYLET